MRSLIRFGAFALTYFLLAKLGMQIRIVTGFSAIFWLPSGFALAMLTIYGRSLWPAIMLAGFAANVTSARPFADSLLLGFGNVLDSLLGSYLLERFGGPRPKFDRLREIGVLIGLSALASNFVGVLCEAGSLWLLGSLPSARFFVLWRSWWLAQSLGSFILGGTILIVVYNLRSRRAELLKRLHWDMAIYVALAVIICAANYTSISSGNPSILLRPYFLSMIMIFAALRYDFLGATVISIIQLVIATYGALTGYKPFRPITTADDALALGQLVVLVNSVTGFILAAVTRERELAIAARDEFLSVASHELKTPLTALSLQLDLARRRLASSPEALPLAERLATSLDVSYRQTKRLSKLVNELLDFTRIESGKISLDLEQTPLEPLVNDVVTRFNQQLTSAGSTVHVDIEQGLIGHWDSSALEQVLTNLISNSVRYAPGTPIHLTGRTNGPAARILVRDHGRGIDAHEKHRIFEKFERSDNLSGAEAGLGLGLYIARSLVEKHGGQLKLEDVEGPGAAFAIELPLLLPTATDS